MSFYIIMLMFCVVIQTNAQVKNVKKYYFPFSELTTPKVYKYTDVDNPKDIIFWHISTEQRKDGLYFTTRAFNQDSIQIEFFEEKINKTGAYVTRFTDLYDTKTKKQGSIKENKVFLWKKSKPYSFKIFIEEGNSIFEKYRSSNYIKLQKEFLGKEVDCIIMDDFYITGSTELKLFFNQKTVYANGIGIIAYKRWRGPAILYNYQLTEILSPEGFIITE